ncbi:MAG: group I intron-associated PD-(D/E)XK endonuclease [Blastocatellia bacterium]
MSFTALPRANIMSHFSFTRAPAHGAARISKLVCCLKIEEAKMQKRQTSARGNVSELKVTTAYVEAGFAVSAPLGGGVPYDLIVDTGEHLLKVQVKTGRLRNGCVIFPMQRFSGHSSKPRSYVRGEIDLFAIYCPDDAKIYVWQFGDNPTQGYLRCSETRNNQRQKIRWAKDYEFEKHVDDLRKEVELVGLEPTAS